LIFGGATGDTTSYVSTIIGTGMYPRVDASSYFTFYKADATTAIMAINSSTPSVTITGTISTKHLIGNTSAPTGAVGTGSGTSPSAVTFSTNANDLSGKVFVTTGTLPTAGATVLTVTFNTAYGTTPIVELFPDNAATALLSGVTMVYTTESTTTFIITAGSTGLVAATAYGWKYIVIQ
jgi:hypothetical protein